jgi:hypothetical protein
VASWQSRPSEIRTDDRYKDNDEIGPNTQQGYIADSLSDEASSEDSFFSPAVQGHDNSRLLMMPETPSHTQRQQGRWRTVNEVLQQQQGQKIYVGIQPHKDVASIPKTKNSDIVRLGFNNVDGIPAMVTNNSKVNTIRRYAYKHDLDGFLEQRLILIGRRCQMKPNFWSCSAQRMRYGQFLLLIDLRIGVGDSKVVLSAWFFGQLASKVRDVGSDDLGQWSWMLFHGRAGHKVQIIMAYQPVVQKATMIGLVYQQHRHHYVAEGFLPSINPIEKFRNDLVSMNTLYFSSTLTRILRTAL